MRIQFPFAAIDFETTGSVAGYPVDPWQVGVVVMHPETEPQCWESLLQVGPRPFHPRAPGRHARIRHELELAPNLEACLPKLREMCLGVPLLAHNIATEQKCLREALPLEPFGPWIDTLKLSRAAWPDLPSHKLEEVLSALGLLTQLQQRFPERQAHDALYDAYGSALILMYLLAQDSWGNVSMAVLQNPDLSQWRRLRAKSSR